MGPKRWLNIRIFRHCFPAILSFVLGVVLTALMCSHKTPQCDVQQMAAIDVHNVEHIAEPATIQSQEATAEPTTEQPTTILPATKEPYPPLLADRKGLVITPHDCPENLFLLILVVTSSRNFESRKAIRRSWGEDSSKKNETSSESFRVVYVLGSDGKNDRLITREAKRYRDIIRGGFEDFYRQNEQHAVKALIGFKWSTTSCKAKFIVKVSSESFVNVPVLISLLKTKAPAVDDKPTDGLYMGFCHGKNIGGVTAVRNSGSPWYISENEWPDKHLPPYASSMGIVMSYDVVEQIVELSVKVRPSNEYVPQKADFLSVGNILAVIWCHPNQFCA
ncbi:hypothetical protein QZH41_001508 [Actinostola sp. cb2023]|nr:hypothetical protein QZH41_001508 [Actinostola sp. cb2023]